MDTVTFCILIAGLLPIVCAGIAKWGFKGYDNRDPRTWLAGQTGFRARANAAQANSFEAFPFFAAGALLALQAEAELPPVQIACVAFVVFRVLYIASYVADRATLRSAFWFGGVLSVVALFVSALRAA
jgi:uncharacterized MAPEG superfamily protein